MGSQNNSKASSIHYNGNGQENVDYSPVVNRNRTTSVANNQECTAIYSKKVSQEIDGKEKFAKLLFHSSNHPYIDILYSLISSIAILGRGGDNSYNQGITNRDISGVCTASPQMVESEACESRMRREVGVQFGGMKCRTVSV